MTFSEIIASFNIALIAGLIGIVVFIMWFNTAKNKKDKRKTLSFVWVIGLGIFAFGMFGSFPALTNPIELGSTLTTGVGPTSLGGVIANCNVEDTTVTLNGLNAFTAVATGGVHHYRVNGGALNSVADAGTFTASPGDALSILWMNGSGQMKEYFSLATDESIECKGTQSIAQELISNGSITTQVFNEDGNAIDVLVFSTAEALAAGDVVALDMNVKGQFEKGVPYGGIYVVEFNKTTIDNVIVDLGGVETEVPSFYDLVNVGDSSTKAYSVPAFSSTEKLEGVIVIDADDTNNPDTFSNITITFYPNDWFINGNTGASFDGPAVEDEDDVQTKLFSSQFTLGVS